MRLFIAIQLNEEMRGALTELQAYMQRLGVRGNFTRRENLHQTVAFNADKRYNSDIRVSGRKEWGL